MTGRRIAIAGFQHETNTFSPVPARFADFEMADSWPPLLRGPEVIAQTRGMNLPTAGAITAAEANGSVEIIPILWCAAEPSGPVTTEAFDRISSMVLDGIAASGPIDGLYLDLHGAMVTEAHPDGEGELLSRIRHRFGDALHIGVSLDLHANISPKMVARADLIAIFRTYPHLDMADTGHRCMAALLDGQGASPPAMAFRQLPFLVPLHAQNTGAEPCRSLYRKLDDALASDAEHADLAMGFTAADIPDCGPAIITRAATAARADAMADALYARFCAAEPTFDTRLFDPFDAVRKALSTPGTGPAIIADVQDNPGAGASSDTTGCLRALVTGGAQNALLGVLHDPVMAAKAHAAGAGAVIAGPLGGRSHVAGDAPFEGRFRVAALSDGRIAYTGAMYGGGTAEIGPSCLLTLDDTAETIRIVVSSVRTQCLDRALFTHFGANPDQADIVCVKSTVHFRADFEPGSRIVINAAAPGGFGCALDQLRYRHLRPGLRLGPNGPAFDPQR